MAGQPPPGGLPHFTYHPDPVATGAIDRLIRTCRVCNRRREWIYVLGAYGNESLRDAVCPWCIADGSAADRCAVRFNVIDDAPAAVPAEVIAEIETRTPGFSGWQAERWLFHCDDGAQFLGAVGWEQLRAHPDAETAVRDEVASWGFGADEVDAVVESLDVDGSVTAYLFACRHCSTHLAYADMD